MGSRAQVLIEDTGVYLYTHWGCYELPLAVQRALSSRRGRGRWSDPEYLARIVFDEMKGDDTTGETGYGIGTDAHGDNTYSPIVINCASQEVRVPGLGTRSFVEFIDYDLHDWSFR